MISILRLLVSVVKEEETATIKAITLEAINDVSKSVELVQDDGNMIDEDMFAVIEKFRESSGEVVAADSAASVFVLSLVCLRDAIPDLRRTKSALETCIRYENEHSPACHTFARQGYDLSFDRTFYVDSSFSPKWHQSHIGVSPSSDQAHTNFSGVPSGLPSR